MIKPYLGILFGGFGCKNENRRNMRLQKIKFWLLVGFVALRPKSTAMVIAGRSVHLTTLFPGQA